MKTIYLMKLNIMLIVCVFTFEAEDSHDLGKVNNIELVSVEYNLEQ